jgi:ATP/maltotriose-dependent transcriptional regulator MalT
LSAMTNLAGDLEKDGHLAAASRMAKRAWQAQEQRTSAKHHETLTALESYAAIRFAQGKHKEAVEYQRRVLALRRRSAGREHVATLSVAYNLATMLSARGSNAEARKILEQTEVDVTRALGPNHPDTIKVRLGLANVAHAILWLAVISRQCHR